MKRKVRQWLEQVRPPRPNGGTFPVPPDLWEMFLRAHGGEPGRPAWPPQAPAEHTALGGLLASATSIGPKALQEDACSHLDLPGCKVVAVADGISSSTDAHQASQTAVQVALAAVLRYWRAGYPITSGALKQAFTEAQAAVRLGAQAGRRTAHPPATTLILAVELRDRFVLAHLGDGAAVFSTGGLQWMANLLYPHTGRAGAITRYLGADGAVVEPTCIELPKAWPDGGILLIGSDGALPLGQVLATAESILEEIQHKAASSGMAGQRADAQGVLEAWVTRHLTTDDNRTLGLVVSERALAHWRSRTPAAAPAGKEDQNHAVEVEGRPEGQHRAHGPAGGTAG